MGIKLSPNNTERKPVEIPLEFIVNTSHTTNSERFIYPKNFGLKNYGRQWTGDVNYLTMNVTPLDPNVPVRIIDFPGGANIDAGDKIRVYLTRTYLKQEPLIELLEDTVEASIIEKIEKVGKDGKVLHTYYVDHKEED